MDNLNLALLALIVVAVALPLIKLIPRRAPAGSVSGYNLPGGNPARNAQSTNEPLPAATVRGIGQGPRVIAGSTYLQDDRISRFESTRVGLEGEERVVNAMRATLSDHWTIFRNVELPDRKGDVDLVLVGPGGIVAVEVKTYTGCFKVQNGSWYKQTSNGYWARDAHGPGAQAIENAKRVHYYLEGRGIKNYVDRVVVSAGDAHINVESTGTEVWTLDALDMELLRLNVKSKLGLEHVNRIVATLESATVRYN